MRVILGDAPPPEARRRAVGASAAQRTPERHVGAMRGASYSGYHFGMTAKKQRLTVTVDPELVDAGQRAVDSGQAESVSGWVSAALAEKIRRDSKLALLAAAVADYEQEFGDITADEMRSQQRADREDAVVVRAKREPRRRARSA